MSAKIGRPKKITGHLARKIFILYAYGLSDAQIADTFGIAESTLGLLKKESDFSESIKRAKGQADLQVQNALFQRAIGYSCPEEKVFCHEGDITTYQTTKHYPPDTMAAMYWLNNRDEGRWKPKRLEIPGNPNEDGTARTLNQLFLTVREGENVKIRQGADSLEVLFGEDFVKAHKEKKHGPDNSPESNGRI